jgi:hypothetical protein
MSGGQFLTQGAGNDTMTGSFTVQGGTIIVSQDNPSNYGTLVVNGPMSWTGGTFQAYVNGSTGGQQTQLQVTGNLFVQSTDTLQINVVGNLTAATWTPITASGAQGIQGTLTLDASAFFTIYYVGGPPPTSIQLTASN